jgi:hypothetical protein
MGIDVPFRLTIMSEPEVTTVAGCSVSLRSCSPTQATAG